MREFIRPWKLATLAIGIGLLLVGADYNQAPDWDYPVSFIMALATYFSAPYSTRVVLERTWKALPLAALFSWLSIDGFYWAYWSTVKPEALIMREANAPASAALYFLCGVIWFYRGSLRDLLGNIKGEWMKLTAKS